MRESRRRPRFSRRGFIAAGLVIVVVLTGIGAYLALIWALGLEREMASLLHPDHDEEGKQLELARTPKRARAKKGPRDAEGS